MLVVADLPKSTNRNKVLYPSKIKSRHTANGILKVAGIKKKYFMRILTRLGKGLAIT